MSDRAPAGFLDGVLDRTLANLLGVSGAPLQVRIELT